MKLLRFIVPALWLVAILYCCRSVISLQPSRTLVVNSPAISSVLATAPPGNVTNIGILINPNFQTVLRAIQQRNGDKPLPKPEVMTIHHFAANQISQTFTLPVTNK